MLLFFYKQPANGHIIMGVALYHNILDTYLLKLKAILNNDDDENVHKILPSHHQNGNYNDDDDKSVLHYQYASITSIRPSTETVQET